MSWNSTIKHLSECLVPHNWTILQIGINLHFYIPSCLHLQNPKNPYVYWEPGVLTDWPLIFIFLAHPDARECFTYLWMGINKQSNSPISNRKLPLQNPSTPPHPLISPSHSRRHGKPIQPYYNAMRMSFWLLNNPSYIAVFDVNTEWQKLKTSHLIQELSKVSLYSPCRKSLPYSASPPRTQLHTGHCRCPPAPATAVAEFPCGTTPASSWSHATVARTNCGCPSTWSTSAVWDSLYASGRPACSPADTGRTFSVK